MTDLFCPACKAAMSPVQDPALQTPEFDLPLLGCDRCGGLWLESGQLDRAVANLRPQASAKRPQLDVKFSYRACPKCDQLMHRRNFASISGIVIDECKLHGSFFDQGELQAIAQFVAGGGLQRAQAFATEEAVRTSKHRHAGSLTLEQPQERDAGDVAALLEFGRFVARWLRNFLR